MILDVLLIPNDISRIKFALNWQVLCGIVKYCKSIVRYRQVSPGIARYCQELPGIAKYCQILPGIARNCQVLLSIARYCEELPQMKKRNIIQIVNFFILYHLVLSSIC